MSGARVHVGDIGTIIELTFRDENNAIVNLASATSKTFYLRKPDKSVLTKTATLTSDGSDGKARYVAINGDIDQVGVWEVQGLVVFASGQWYSTRTSFPVEGNLV